MSNRAKSILCKVCSFLCCTVPPVIVMVQNGCFEPRNANAFQRLGIMGIGLVLVLAIGGGRYIRQALKPVITSPFLIFLALWVVCGALSGVILEFAQAMKIGFIGSCFAVVFDVIAFVYKSKADKEKKG